VKREIVRNFFGEREIDVQREIISENFRKRQMLREK
jgi:hypothetical protein